MTDWIFWIGAAAVLIGLAWVGWSPLFTIRIEFPQVGLKRLIFTCVLAATAMVLWFWAAAKGLAGMRPTWRVVVGGIAIPWGVGWVALLLMERRVRSDLARAERRQLPEHDHDVATETRPDRGQVRTEEVLPR